MLWTAHALPASLIPLLENRGDDLFDASVDRLVVGHRPVDGHLASSPRADALGNQFGGIDQKPRAGKILTSKNSTVDDPQCSFSSMKRYWLDKRLE